VVLQAGSFNMQDIVLAQQQPSPIPGLSWLPNWYILPQFLGFVTFLIAGLAETHRLPLDLPEAEHELTAGFHTEYSGMKWGLIQLGEYAAIIGFSGIIATLFLSGWKGPFFLPGYAWFVLKMLFIISAFIWVRATIPRLRVDQIMTFGWKFLLPLAIVNTFATAAEVIAYPDGLPEWLIAVNFGAAAVAIAGAARLAGFFGRAPEPAPPGWAVMVPSPALGGVQIVARGS
jgi:NADH-quinone oxidoreductase subunit H